MTTCANCVSDAKYTYVGIQYCEKHLPRFLRDRSGLPGNDVVVLGNALNAAPVLPAPPVEIISAEILEEVAEEAYAEPVEETVKEVEEAPKTQPKKKATPKAD